MRKNCFHVALATFVLLFCLCVVVRFENLQQLRVSNGASGAVVNTGRRLLWSEQLIHDRMAQIDATVELFDYQPQLIRLRDGDDGRAAVRADTHLTELAEPLSWTLDGITHRFWPACESTTVAQHNAFELAWSQYVQFHHRMTRGELEPRFVHVGFPPEAAIHARMKVIVSATLLGLALQRAVVISWVPTPIDSGLQHSALVELFRSPGFDWFYTKQKYDAAQFRRLDVFGFGQESDETTTYEPLEALLCADLETRQEAWLELHWKFDSFAAAVYHNPFLNDKLSKWFAADDIYGPIARKLFFPVSKIWRRVESIYAKQFDKNLYRRAQQEAIAAAIDGEVGELDVANVTLQQHQLALALAKEERRKNRKSNKLQQKQQQQQQQSSEDDDWSEVAIRKRVLNNDNTRERKRAEHDLSSLQPKSLYVVGLEVNRPSELGKLKECVDAANLRPKFKHRRGKKAAAAAAALAARDVRFFVMSPTQKGARDALVSAYGSEHAFYYHNSDLSSDERFETKYPADAREIVEEFLFEFCDAVMVPAKTERNRHMLFSKRALVVVEQRQDDAPICSADVQCQPCWNWSTVTNATCWRDIKRNVPSSKVCQHSLWYRW